MKLVLALVLGYALTAVPALAGDNASLRTSLHADLARYLAARAKPEHISAVSLSVSLHGMSSNINVTAGTTRYGGRVRVTPADLFEIGSNTKAFTSVAILQLEAQGKLTINQTVGDWLPQYPAWKSVSIRRLLNMTSGIPSYDNVPAMLTTYVKNPYRTFSAAELVAFVDPKYPHAPKRTTGWSYSNTNYILAQMIVERASGHSYAGELERRFLHRGSGLADTFYRPGAYPHTVLARLVAGYFFSTDPGNENLRPLLGHNVKDLNLSWTQGAGGIISTPADVTHWSRGLYVGNRLAAKQRRELTSIVSVATGKPIPKTSASDPRGFGLGVGQSTTPKLGTFWYYQGETLGYRMVYFWLPKVDAVIAVGLNSQPNGAEDRVGSLMESVYATLKAAGNL